MTRLIDTRGPPPLPNFSPISQLSTTNANNLQFRISKTNHGHILSPQKPQRRKHKSATSCLEETCWKLKSVLIQFENDNRFRIER